MLRWFLDADDNEDSPHIWLLLFGPCSLKFAYKFIPWYLHYVDKLTNKKYAKTINLLCAGKNVFVKYQAQGGFNPNPLAHALAEYKLSALQASISEENTINVTTQQFITAKNQAAHWNSVVKHTHHCVRAICSCKIRLRWCLLEYEQSSTESVWLDRLATLRFARSNLAKLHKNWECAWSTQENFQFFIMYRTPANV